MCRLLYACAPAIALGSCPAGSFDEAWMDERLCVRVFARNLKGPRGMALTAWGDVLVVERGGDPRIVALWDTDGDGLADKQATVGSAPGLTHGIALQSGYLYASSDTTVYRWRLPEGSRVGESREVVIHSMNADGNGGAPRGHWTRTLVFDDAGRLYVSIGSAGNIDTSSYRSRIRRFQIPEPLPAGGVDFTTGEVFMDGLRNEVGLAFDSAGVLWGVENSADRLVRTDLGGDIHNDNPAEELNRFPESNVGKSYGYPWCWTEYKLPSNIGNGPGTIWAWPSTVNDGIHSDAWCRENSVPPALAMQAHWAPLGVTFYRGAEGACNVSDEQLPSDWIGHAFIANHGSWNRDIPVGYNVVRVPFAIAGDEKPSGNPVDVMRHAGHGAKWNGNIRPADVQFDACGRLLVSSDGVYNGNTNSFSEGHIFLITSKTNMSGTPPSSTTLIKASTSTAKRDVIATSGSIMAMHISVFLIVLCGWSCMHLSVSLDECSTTCTYKHA